MSRWMADTSAEAEKRYWQITRDTPPEKRLRQTADMSASIRYLMDMGVRHRHPEASDAEVRRRVFELMYGREFSPEQLREWERRHGLLDPTDQPAGGLEPGASPKT